MANVQTCANVQTFNSKASIHTLNELTNQNLSEDFTEMGLLRLTAQRGLSVILTPYGARTVRVLVPNQCEEPVSVALGYDSLAEYMSDTSYQGAIVGRNANRIAGAAYIDPITGRRITLDQNDGKNNLHGGSNGWDKQKWNLSYSGVSQQGIPQAIFTLTDETELSHFPGRVDVVLRVSIRDIHTIEYRIEATTNETTVINPTVHTYFNLDGAGARTTVHGHVMETNATHFLPTENLIPTGQLVEVQGTRYDFREQRSIGSEFGEQGYDDCLVRTTEGNLEMKMVSLRTGITLKASSDPGTRSAQFYTGHFLEGSPANQYGGLCWEPGTIIDAPNQQQLCSVVGMDAFVEAGTRIVRTINYRLNGQEASGRRRS